MKAAAFLGTNEIRVIEVEKPVPGAGEVLIKVAYCGVCATDYDNFRGYTSFAKNGELKYPLRFGHEWSGIIVEIGEGVEGFSVGDPVIGDGKVTCGKCENCKAGRWYDCTDLRAVGTVKDHWPGAMAEYILMPARNVYKINENVSLKEAAMCEPFVIALNGFREYPVSGKTVLVIGSGPIGLGGVIAARALGAKKIICAARKPSKLNKALELGATDILNITEGALYELLPSVTGGKKVDFCLETSGCVEYVENAARIVANMGTMSMVGFYDRPIRNMNVDDIVYNKITLRGVSGSREYTPVAAQLLNEGKINLMPLLTHEVDFSQVEGVMDFYEQTAEDRIKILVRIGGDRDGGIQ